MSTTEVLQLTSENCPFEPIEDYLIVKRVWKEETSGGIVLPQSTKDRKGKFGVRAEVIAVGPGKRLEDGTLYEVPVQPGDFILFTGHAGIELEAELKVELGLNHEEADQVLLLRSVDIICKLKNQ